MRVITPHGPYHSEGLWAIEVDAKRGHYRLDNTPFFAYGISYGDVVLAKPDPDGVLIFKRVVESSGRLTLRIMLDEGTSEETFHKLADEVKAAGGDHLEGGFGILIAFDVPNDKFDDITRFLQGLENDGRIRSWEHGCD